MSATQPGSTKRLAQIDADAHVVETERTWEYLDPSEAKYRPKLFSSADDPQHQYWVINGKVCGFRFPTLSEKELENQSKRTGRRVNVPQSARELDDVALRLAGMDELGLDVQVLHNSLWIEPVTDLPEAEAALCRSWNRWLADIHAQGNGRLYWTCVVPVFDIEVAIDEMRFAHEHGAVGLCLRPYEGDLVVTDPEFYPLFEEAVRLDMAIAIHIGNGSRELTRLLKTRNFTGSGWAPFRVPTVVATMAIINSPIHAEFPALRWGIIEASASWVPWLCHEVQRRTNKPFGPDSNPFVDRNIYVTAQVDDDIPYILNAVGEGVLVIGTDFGHTDTSSEYDALMKLRRSTDVSETAKTAMLSTNPARLYALGERATPAGTLSP